MIRSSLKDFYDNLQTYLTDRQNRTFLCIYEQTEINYGSSGDCDIEWCEKNNIPTYNIERSAGCCVNAAGNINIADIRFNENDWIEHQILPDLRDYLLSKGLNAELDNNDILIDGYKVAAAGGMLLEPDYKWEYTCFQISINQDIEVIRNACKKPMKKEPRGLSYYGITTEEMAEWCENWFNNYEAIQE